MGSEERRGNEMRPWSFAGYEGFKCGSAQLGTRHDGTCIRISSGVAFDHWLEVWHAAEKFSRADLQLTLRVDGPPSRTISSVYHRALHHSRKSKRGPTVSLLKSSNGTATVYLGRRVSDVFMRCYDKGAESGLDHYENSVRFEVELKGDACLPVVRHCASSTRPLLTAAGYVLGQYSKRGVSISLPAKPSYAISVPRKRSDIEKKLRWLETSVRPTVQLLIALGHSVDVRRSLDWSGASPIPTKRATVIRTKRFGG